MAKKKFPSHYFFYSTLLLSTFILSHSREVFAEETPPSQIPSVQTEVA